MVSIRNNSKKGSTVDGLPSKTINAEQPVQQFRLAA